MPERERDRSRWSSPASESAVWWIKGGFIPYKPHSHELFMKSDFFEITCNVCLSTHFLLSLPFSGILLFSVKSRSTKCYGEANFKRIRREHNYSMQYSHFCAIFLDTALLYLEIKECRVTLVRTDFILYLRSCVCVLPLQHVCAFICGRTRF